jgi:hypothetical protein
MCVFERKTLVLDLSNNVTLTQQYGAHSTELTAQSSQHRAHNTELTAQHSARSNTKLARSTTTQYGEHSTALMHSTVSTTQQQCMILEPSVSGPLQRPKTIIKIS